MPVCPRDKVLVFLGHRANLRWAVCFLYLSFPVISDLSPLSLKVLPVPCLSIAKFYLNYKMLVLWGPRLRILIKTMKGKFGVVWMTAASSLWTAWTVRKQPCLVSLCCPGVTWEVAYVQDSNLLTLLPLLPTCWFYRCAAPCPVRGVLGIEPRASCMLGDRSANWATAAGPVLSLPVVSGLWNSLALTFISSRTPLRSIHVVWINHVFCSPHSSFCSFSSFLHSPSLLVGEL